jgi:hypothetical protein
MYEGIIIEYCDGKCLWQHLHKPKWTKSNRFGDNELRGKRWNAAIVFAQGIAAGLVVRHLMRETCAY